MTAGATLSGQGRDLQAIDHADLCCAGFYKAAMGPSSGGTGVERARHHNAVMVHATHEVDGPLFTTDQGLGLASSGMVDDG